MIKKWIYNKKIKEYQNNFLLLKNQNIELNKILPIFFKNYFYYLNYAKNITYIKYKDIKSYLNNIEKIKLKKKYYYDLDNNLIIIFKLLLVIKYINETNDINKNEIIKITKLSKYYNKIYKENLSICNDFNINYLFNKYHGKIKHINILKILCSNIKNNIELNKEFYKKEYIFDILNNIINLYINSNIVMKSYKKENNNPFDFNNTNGFYFINKFEEEQYPIIKEYIKYNFQIFIETLFQSNNYKFILYNLIVYFSFIENQINKEAYLLYENKNIYFINKELLNNFLFNNQIYIITNEN